jgi:hypothetical protein
MLFVIMLSVIMLNVVMLSVVMLHVVAPLNLCLLTLLHIGEVCMQKCHQYRNMILPSLLGLANRNDPIYVTPPKVAVIGVIALKRRQWKHSFTQKFS